MYVSKNSLFNGKQFRFIYHGWEYTKNVETTSSVTSAGIAIH